MSKPLLPDDLWAKIEPLLPRPKRRRFRHPGRKPLDRRKVRLRFEERFTARRMATDYVRLYKSLVRQTARSARDARRTNWSQFCNDGPHCVTRLHPCQRHD